MFLIWNICSFLFIVISELLKNNIDLSEVWKLIIYIFNIISTSFLASSIFYYVQSYRPQKIIEKKSYLSIEDYLIRLKYDLEVFNLWFYGWYSIDEDAKLKINTCSENYLKIQSLVESPKTIKPLLIQIKDKITSIKMTGLSENLEFELNQNLNKILIFIEDELGTKLYSNKYLDTIYFGSFAKKSEVIIEAYNFLDDYIIKKNTKYKKITK